MKSFANGQIIEVLTHNVITLTDTSLNELL